MAQRRRGFGRLRRERSGRYSAAYVGPDLRLHRAPETFKAKIDAEGWLAVERRQIDLDQWVPPGRRHHRIAPESDPTVGSYATAWLADRSERDANDPMALRLSSVKDYELTLKNHIVPKLGSIRLAELEASDIETWYRALGARKTPRARAKAYSLLRTILNAAKNDPHAPLTENPAHIKGAGRVPRSSQIHPATLDELRVITQAMPDKLRLAVQLGAWCALRYGEVFELRRKDLDLQTGVVHVRRGVVWTRGMVTTDRPKTSAGVRDVTIPPHVMPMVAHHLERYVAKSQDALLFPDGEGRNRRPHDFARPWHAARAAAGRDDLIVVPASSPPSAATRSRVLRLPPFSASATVMASHCAQLVRSAYHQTSHAAGQRIAIQVLDAIPGCPIPEIARLGRTLRQWRTEFLGCFDTGGAKHGGTEAVNGLIELHRRIARGFRNLDNYRLRMLLVGGGLTHPHLR